MKKGARDTGGESRREPPVARASGQPQIVIEVSKHLGIKVRVTTGGINLKDDIMQIYEKVHRGEDVGNVALEQRDKPKNQSGKMMTSLQGRADSIVDRANREGSRTGSQDLEISEEVRVEEMKVPSIVIGIQFDRLGKTRAQFHTRFKSHRSRKLGKQGESGRQDSQAKFPHIRAPGQPHTKGP